MTSWKTLSNRKYLTVGIFIVALLLSCKQEEAVPEVVVATVGNSHLTENELKNNLGEMSGQSKYRDEYIRNWLETELLFKLAIDKKLLSDDNYHKILDNSSKVLGANIALQDYLDHQAIDFSNATLKKYYNENKDDYVFLEDAYVVNLISFSDETTAIAFRNSALKAGWDNAIKNYSEDSSTVHVDNQRIYKLSEIQSKPVSRILGSLFQGEISVVVKTELNTFVIVQQLDKIKKNSIPQFKYVIDDVRDSYLIVESRERVKNFIDSLKLQQNVKIY